MDSHQYADSMIALAEWLKSKPAFETEQRGMSESFWFYGNKEAFLGAVRAVGAGTKEYKKLAGSWDIIFRPNTPAGTELRLGANRDVVCKKIQEEKWKCIPLLSEAEEAELKAS
jgi:hypothetical protein